MCKGRKLFYWIITGIFLSVALSSMILTRDGGIQQFYDEGYAVDLKDDWTYRAVHWNQYDAKQKIYSWRVGEDTPYIVGHTWREEINYLLIEAESISGEMPVWRIFYRDAELNIVQAEEFAFQNGKLVIPIREVEDTRIWIYLGCNSDIEYKVNSMRLTEYENTIPGIRIVYGSLICFAAYLIISFALSKIRKNRRPDFGGIVCGLEHQADAILQYCNHPRNTERYAGWIRTILIAALIAGWRIYYESVTIVRNYGYIVFYHMVLFLALVAWIPREGEKTGRDSSLLRSWLLLCLVQFLSDILVGKAYGFAEVWIFLSFGLLYRAWGRMKKPEKLLEDFARAAEILYLVNVVYCFSGAYRYTESGRLNGTWEHLNLFAITIVLYSTVLLFRLYQNLFCNKRWYYAILYMAESVIGAWMLYKTACRTAWLAMAVVVLVFILQCFRKITGKLTIRNKSLMIGIACFMFAVGGVVLYQKGILFSTRRVETFSVDSISSGRIVIWKEHLKQMNLLGHPGLASVEGTMTRAHNALIKQMYKYGILAGIAAIWFMTEAVRKGCKVWKRRSDSAYSFFVIGVLLSYIVSAALECVNEYPMTMINWFACYWVIGYLIQSRDDKNVE